jgi:hypothetical protein
MRRTVPERNRFSWFLQQVRGLMAISRWKQIFGHAIIRPFTLLIREPIIKLVALYMAFLYGLLYCKLSISYPNHC